MNNAEWMIKNGYKFSDIRCCYELNKTVTFLLKGTIVGKASYDNTCLNTFKAWLDKEREEKILNDAERRYLSAVIRPFRDRVEYIVKSSSWCNRDCCYIKVGFHDLSDDMKFPLFREDDMYKGMETGKRYTLEELGL